jgi:hypothetical protein
VIQHNLERDEVVGTIVYFPTWDLNEVLMARRYLKGAVNMDEEVVARFREVGGVPRYIQNAAISALTATQATQIGCCRIVFKPCHEKVGNWMRETQDGREIMFWYFRNVKLISPLVEEKVVSTLPELMYGVP